MMCKGDCAEHPKFRHPGESRDPLSLCGKQIAAREFAMGPGLRRDDGIGGAGVTEL